MIGSAYVEFNEEGLLQIGFEDYEVDAFGGGDFYWYITLDKENANKLFKHYHVSKLCLLEIRILEEFGNYLQKSDLLKQMLNENKIAYSEHRYSY